MSASTQADENFSDNTDPQTSYFQRLPPEVRNAIFGLALVNDEPLDVEQPFPGITGTCKQLRSESLPVYLGNNNFVVSVPNRNFHSIMLWLRIIEGLPPETKALIRSLTVNCEGYILYGLDSIELSNAVKPEFDVWNNLIRLIAQSGLCATQLSWPGLPQAGTEDSILVSGVTYALGKNLYNNYVLHPLLKRHVLYGDARPPVDVWNEIKGWHPRAKLMFLRGLARIRSISPPDRWFEDWVTSLSLGPARIFPSTQRRKEGKLQRGAEAL